MPSAARAAAPVCRTLLESTPGAWVDLDGDGYPEYQAPRIYDLTLCADAGASYVVHPPRIERCFVGWRPTCVAVYVTVSPVWPQAGARADLCYTSDGGYPTCASIATEPLPAPVEQTVCVGVDVNGGFPCSGAVLTLE